jgi:hypothetical protein
MEAFPPIASDYEPDSDFYGIGAMTMFYKKLQQKYPQCGLIAFLGRNNRKVVVLTTANHPQGSTERTDGGSASRTVPGAAI